MSRVWLTAFCLLLLGGCTHLHLDRLPKGMQQKAAPITEAAIEAHSHKLQIIITRSPVYFSHSALRLIHGDKMLFWDPAGGYGLTENYPAFYKAHPLPASFKKHNDLITAGVPSLSRYWAYSHQAGDNGMEVLEWDLSAGQAARYYDILLQGSRENTGVDGFATKRHFLLCSSNLTRFLVRFTRDTVGLKQIYFWPDNLAHELYQRHPDRVIFFDAEGVRIFTDGEIQRKDTKAQRTQRKTVAHMSSTVACMELRCIRATEL